MLISIITINYNNKNGLRNTIESVLNQNYSHIEFIIIDGGSTDGSLDIIKEYAHKIDFWVSEPDSGVYNAMNKGIRVSHGDLLNFMNSGDCFFDNNVVDEISQYDTNYDIIVGKDYHYNEKKRQGFASILPPWISAITLYMDTLPHQAAFFKRDIFSIQQYDESFQICADWAFYAQKIIIEDCKVKTIERIICRREEGGMSTTQTELLKKERETHLNIILPKGVIHDYATIEKLDKATAYKFFVLCNNTKSRKWLRLLIKVLFRLVNWEKSLITP